MTASNITYYVYGLQAVGDPDGPVKIGFSNTPTRRLEALQPGALGARLQIIFQMEAGPTKQDGRKLEYIYHKQFAEHRINGEWFQFVHEMLTWQPDGCRRIYGATRGPAANCVPYRQLNPGDTRIFLGWVSPPERLALSLPAVTDLSAALVAQKILQRPSTIGFCESGDLTAALTVQKIGTRS